MLDAVAALPRDEFQITVAYSWDDWLPYLAHYNISSVKIYKSVINRALPEAWGKAHLPLRGWRALAPFVHPASRKFLKQDCDLWVFPSQDSWSFWVPVPALSTIHDLMHRYQSQFPEVSARGEYRRRERHYERTCRWARAVVVDSEIGKQHVHESYKLDPSRIYVLPFTPPKYIYSERVPADFDDRYQLPDKFIFYPAQFWEHKNHKGLIRASKRIKPVIPDLKLVLVGSKKNGYSSAHQLIASLGLIDDITFIDYVPDEYMPAFYRRARALIMPTRFGPTNIPPLEAFVTECPVAASNIYGMQEQLGDAAILFNPNSDEAIADAILRLWTDDNLCERLKECGLKQASKYDQSHFNQRLLIILRRMIQEDDVTVQIR